MTSFKKLDLKISYRTKKEDPIQDFFAPVLSNAQIYNVAVGYFSSKWIQDNCEGIINFAKNGGRAKWIISPYDLSEQDRKMLIQAYEQEGRQAKAIEAQACKNFDALFEQLKEDTRIAIAWLIYDGILDFKMGIVIDDQNLPGILHSKMGYFKDAEGNELAFSGSYNLTGQAQYNWERFDVFLGWEGGRDFERTRQIKYDFQDMWDGQDESIIVFNPSEKALEKFKSVTTTTKRPYILPEGFVSPRKKVQVPRKLLDDEGNLRDYQEQAISKWISRNGRGVFNMATGSGKTATALTASTRILKHIVENKKKPLLIVVSVPFVSLADQWAEEAEEFNFDVLRCYGSRESWKTELQDQLQSLQTEKEGYCFVVCVNRTFTGITMQKLIQTVRFDFLFIGDEMHNLGAASNLEALPSNANFRIGLSATPDREYDEEGTKELQKYFGDEVIEFTIGDALDRGFLCKYYYYPIIIELTDDEWDQYYVISNKISKLMGRLGEEALKGESTGLSMLLFERARLLGKAENKKTKLIEILAEYKTKSHILVYCSDAKEDGLRQVDLINKAIIKHLGMKVNKFTSEEDKESRKRILADFKSGNSQAMIAIKCLDEGIDVPKTETAFILASSTTKRQFIQRRGRILRKAPDKEYAYLYDFIAMPRLEEDCYDGTNAYKIERSLFMKELERINEFSMNAVNSGHTLEILRPLREKLNLMDH